MSHPKRILISRTDNLGDIVLTLPLVMWLKQQFPGVEILFMCREYAADIVLACPGVDQVVIWSTEDRVHNLAAKLIALEVDVILHVFPRKAIARAAWQAKIPLRIGTSHRWYHWLFCNRRVAFSRAKSPLHEAQLNFKLLKGMGLPTEIDLPALEQFVCLKPLQVKPAITQCIDPKRFTVILHPLSNANGRDWPLSHYIELLQQLPEDQFQVLLNGVPAEASKMQMLVDLVPESQRLFQLSLAEKLVLFQRVDAMVVGSTGPMHIMAALGQRVLGLFPPKPTMHPDRWGPIGPRAEFIVQSEPCHLPCQNGACACMNGLTVQEVLTTLHRWQQQKVKTT